MTEKVKVEIVNHPPINGQFGEFNNETCLTSTVSFGIPNEKATVWCPQVKYSEFDSFEAIDARLIEIWGPEGGLQATLDDGQKVRFTRPTFPKIAVIAEAVAAGDTDEALRLCQEAVDNYNPGRRAASGVTQKEVVRKAKALETQVKDLGMDMDEALAKVKLLMSQGLI